MLPLAEYPTNRNPDGPGRGCLVAILGGLLLWASWTALAFALGRWWQ